MAPKIQVELYIEGQSSLKAARRAMAVVMDAANVAAGGVIAVTVVVEMQTVVEEVADTTWLAEVVGGEPAVHSTKRLRKWSHRTFAVQHWTETYWDMLAQGSNRVCHTDHFVVGLDRAANGEVR